MLRWLTVLLLFPLCIGASSAMAQPKKPASVGKPPTAKERSIAVTTHMPAAGQT